MADRHELRAADSDRDRIADILRDAHGEGRLGHDELLARVEAAYAARTYVELDRVIADLPVARPAQVARPPQPVRPARRLGRRIIRGTLTVAWWFFGFVVALNVLIWMGVSISQASPQYFWPFWVAGPWLLILGTAEMAYRARE
ncbi:DUF1707 SHOCT-like domain-containing protein [Haloactinopolyspora alba]|nr:DUF1707 domain-containing protein [Haloactinopolyspora alba]